VAEDVDLSPQLNAVASQVIVTARDLDGAGARRGREALVCAPARVGFLVEQLGEIEAALTLRLVVGARDLGRIGHE
jgi:hypothetical protein